MDNENKNKMIALSLNTWHQFRSTFEYQGNKISYHVQGPKDAPCLILIHGFPTASWDWHLQWHELTKHFRVFTLDMLGYGYSDKPKNIRYSIATQADIVTYFLKQFDVAEVHIFSHDYGDTVAQELLARNNLAEPNAINILSVCLLNGGLFAEAHQPLFLQKLLLSPIGGIVANLANFNQFKKNFDRICVMPLAEEKLKEMWQLIAYNNGKPVLAKLIHYIPERVEFRERWVGALQNTTAPVRFICGMEDPISGRHMVEHYRELINEPDIVELEGVGHYPQLESPELVLSSFLEFHRIK